MTCYFNLLLLLAANELSGFLFKCVSEIKSDLKVPRIKGQYLFAKPKVMS